MDWHGPLKRVAAPAARVIAAALPRRGTVLAPVLCYHGVGQAAVPGHVSADRFLAQMRYLREHFDVVALEDCVARLASNPGSGRAGPMPVCITFDDGYHNVLTRAVPILKAYAIRAIAFIVPGKLGATADWDDAAPRDERILLSETDLERLVAAGLTLGGHSWSHDDLTRCSDVQLEDELGRCANYLRERWSIDRPLLAYPWGRYDQRVIAHARSAGFAGAVGGGWLRHQVPGAPFEIGRITVGHEDGVRDLAAKLRGGYGWWTRGWWTRG